MSDMAGFETTTRQAAVTAMQDAYGLALAAHDGPPPENSAADTQAVAELPPQPGALAPGGGVEIPCARYIGQPMTRCAANVVRGSAGKADVTVTWPDGGARVISFQAGQPSGSDAPDELRFTREGGLCMIRIGVSERFEITDAVLSGDRQ
jgi:hypothetical protein